MLPPYGPPKVSFRPGRGVAKAGARPRPAGEVLTVRRQRRRIAERTAESQLRIEHDRELAPDRYELQVVVRGAPVLDFAPRQRVTDVEAMAHAAVGEDRAVAGIVAPAEVELVRIEFAAHDLE